MGSILVHKLSSRCLTGSEAIARVADLVEGATAAAPAVVVVSCLAGTAGLLRGAAEAAARGELGSAIGVLTEQLGRHESTLHHLVPAEPGPVTLELRGIAEEVRDLLRGAALLGELSLRTRDRILSAAEKLAARVFAAALRSRGLPAVALDSDEFVETDGEFGEANVLSDVAGRTISAVLGGHLEAGALPIVAGHSGRAPDGATTTLGRGGADLTATLIAAALGAREVHIWTDRLGIFTADPATVPEALPIEQLNYREASELSYYGVEALHLRSMAPVLGPGIPIRVRSALAPEEPGTVVDSRFRTGSHPVKGVAAAKGQCLLAVEGRGGQTVPLIAARAFRVLAEAAVRVTMVSQASSESSVCIAVPVGDSGLAEAALKREFRRELTTGEVDDIAVTHGLALVAVVGLGIRHTPGVGARLFSALARRRINAVACAQGSSQFNVTVAVDEDRADEAVRAIHQDFGLHRRDTGSDAATAFDLVLLGRGKLARCLHALIERRRPVLEERFGLRARLVAVIDERGNRLVAPGGLTAEQLAPALAEGASSLAECPGALASPDALTALREVFGYRLVRPVVLDTALPPTGHEVLVEALRLGADVVTANKRPLAGPLAQYEAIRREAEATGRILGVEATLGAALPVFDTIARLLAAGDRITRIRAAVSGTVGHVLRRVAEGATFAEAGAEAYALGFTEPDPLDDLSGRDMLEKAVIMARAAGLVLSDGPVAPCGLVDLEPGSVAPERLAESLAPYERRVRALVEGARERGRAVRFVATITPAGVELAFEEASPDTPLGLLQGTDKTVLIETDRYHMGPLVLSGPGVGADVAAMGMLHDLLHIAAERR